MILMREMQVIVRRMLILVRIGMTYFFMGSSQARHEGNHEKSNMVLRHVDTDAHVLKKNYSLVNIKICSNDQQPTI
jgi:hypothetical protein